jgi:type IV pilus biogenesis protein CpaD/CtpE
LRALLPIEAVTVRADPITVSPNPPQGVPMSKIVLVAALLGIAACAPRDEQPPAADTAMPAPVAPAPIDTAIRDTMARDTARDTTTAR